MAYLLNKKAVRDLALACSANNRAGKFTRVSPKFLNRLNAVLRNLVEGEVHRHPSVGKTLM